MKTIVITVLCLAVTLTACSKDSAIKNTESTQALRIAAAANLSDVLPKVIAGYKVDNNLPAQEIEVTYASSGKLYAQITSGAPYDLFLSANQEFPTKLAAEALAIDKATSQNSTQPFTYTQGQLALYSVVHSLSELNPATLNKLLTAKSAKVTIANPANSQSQNISVTQVQKLATLLYDHIRFEERELFPIAERYLTTAELDAIYTASPDSVKRPDESR